MKSKKTMKILPMTLLLAAVALLPSASADHGWHECTEADPCDDWSNNGCEGLAGVDCPYEEHDQCYMSNGVEYCRHTDRNCLVSLLDWCYLQGTLPVNVLLGASAAQVQ